jgi:AraC-like DNA-binding protein
VDVRIQILTSLIQCDFCRDLRLDELAHLVNLSPSRLRHLFKHDTGQTLAQYLMYTRMQHARVLLETTHLSVKEAMNQVGIGDCSHFARDFKKLYGVSPTSCRQQRSLVTTDVAVKYLIAALAKK